MPPKGAAPGSSSHIAAKPPLGNRFSDVKKSDIQPIPSDPARPGTSSSRGIPSRDPVSTARVKGLLGSEGSNEVREEILQALEMVDT